jgi:hypothetical protein
MVAKPKSSSRRTNALAQSQPSTSTGMSYNYNNLVQQIPQKSRRRQSVSAAAFWKLGLPIVLLLSVFMFMDRAGREIQDMFNVQPVAKSTSTSMNHHNSDDGSSSNDSHNRNINNNNKIPFGTNNGGSSINSILDHRTAERRKKRDQRRHDLVGDKRKQSRKRFGIGTLLGGSRRAIPFKSSSSNTDTDTSSLVLFDYHQPTVRSNTTLQDPTADYSAHKTVVFCMSARENFERRAVIRQTWGAKHAVYFVIGGQPEEEHKSIHVKLEQEQVKHQDLLDSIHPESYRSLPHKLVFAYQYIYKRWLQVQWFVKVDDDTVVRIDTLQKVVLGPMNPEIPIVAGRIIVDAPVHKGGKWAEVNYPHSTYPYWAQGSCGHAVSRPVVAYLVGKQARAAAIDQKKNNKNKNNNNNNSTRSTLYLYQGEDTSLGIWLHEASIAKELHVTWLNSKYFVNSGKCQEKQWLIIGHQITAAQMKACYKLADEWSDDYGADVSKNFWHMETEAQKNPRYGGSSSGDNGYGDNGYGDNDFYPSQAYSGQSASSNDE